MPLQKRVIRLKFKFQGGSEKVIESIGGNLNIKVRINKAASSLQQQCSIEITNLTLVDQALLLSEFSAYQQKLVANGAAANYCDVTVLAGYASAAKVGSISNEMVQTLFIGQIVNSELVEGPPNTTIRIECYTRQIDKSNWVAQFPKKAPYRQLCQMVASAIGVTLLGQTSKDDQIVSNFGVSVGTLSGLVTELQTLTNGETYAFVDNGRLIVSDINKTSNPNSTPVISDFIGIPVRDPYGAHWKTLLSQNLPSLGDSVTLKSRVIARGNSADYRLVDGTYIVTILQYELCTFAAPFYCTGWGVLPA
jgi:hypothetical protein